MNENIDKELCVGCGEYKPEGIIAQVSHGCPGNTYEYKIYSGSSFIRNFNDLVYKMYGSAPKYVSIEGFLNFPHFKAIDTSINEHPLDRMLYGHARQFEIKLMKRLRKWIKIEDDFNYKY